MVMAIVFGCTRESRCCGLFKALSSVREAPFPMSTSQGVAP